MFSAHVYFNILSKNASCFAIKKINKKIDRKKKIVSKKNIVHHRNTRGQELPCKIQFSDIFPKDKIRTNDAWKPRHLVCMMHIHM